MSTQRAQSEITSSEFPEWIAFLNQEETKRTKQDFYLASIAAEVRKGNVKHPKKVKISDLFIRYAKKKVKMTIKQKSDEAKAFFGALLGSSKKKKKRKR
jgi:hypothetical protein